MNAKTLLAGERQDKALDALLVLIGLMALVTLVGVGWLLTSGFSQQRSVDAVAVSTELSSCRSLARVPIDEARTVNDALILRGLVASATGDDALMTDVLSEAEAGIALVVEATLRYVEAVERSSADPEGFLADCQLPEETP